MEEAVADGQRERDVAVVGGGDARKFGKVEEELPLEVEGDGVGVVAEGDVVLVHAVCLGVGDHGAMLRHLDVGSH